MEKQKTFRYQRHGVWYHTTIPEDMTRSMLAWIYNIGGHQESWQGALPGFKFFKPVGEGK